jgi:hypothetical protein
MLILIYLSTGVVDDLRNQLFATSRRTGEDLLLYNIMRGRDAGLPCM